MTPERPSEPLRPRDDLVISVGQLASRQLTVQTAGCFPGLIDLYIRRGDGSMTTGFDVVDSLSGTLGPGTAETFTVGGPPPQALSSCRLSSEHQQNAARSGATTLRPLPSRSVPTSILIRLRTCGRSPRVSNRSGARAAAPCSRAADAARGWGLCHGLFAIPGNVTSRRGTTGAISRGW